MDRAGLGQTARGAALWRRRACSAALRAMGEAVTGLDALKSLVNERADATSALRCGGRMLRVRAVERPETGRLFQAIHGNDHWHTVPKQGLMPLPAPAPKSTAVAHESGLSPHAPHRASGTAGASSGGTSAGAASATTTSLVRPRRRGVPGTVCIFEVVYEKVGVRAVPAIRGRLLHTMRQQQRFEVTGMWGEWLRLKGDDNERWILSRHESFGTLVSCIDGEPEMLPEATSNLGCEDCELLRWSVQYKVMFAPVVVMRFGPRADARAAGGRRVGTIVQVRTRGREAQLRERACARGPCTHASIRPARSPCARARPPCSPWRPRPRRRPSNGAANGSAYRLASAATTTLIGPTKARGCYWSTPSSARCWSSTGSPQRTPAARPSLQSRRRADSNVAQRAQRPSQINPHFKP